MAPLIVKDLNTDTASSLPTSAIDLGGVVLFSAFNENGRELWRSDGTEPGTIFVKDINPGIANSNPTPAIAFNGLAFFSAIDSARGRELWRSDGTSEGTLFLKDISPGLASSTLADFLIFNNSLYFTANGQLWKTDGSPTGTVMVDNSIGYSNLTLFNSSIYFSGSAAASGAELWRSDGTAGGTSQVKDINAGASSSSPSQLTVVNGTLFFIALTNNDARLWKTDGTTQGTVLFYNLATNTTADFQNLTELNGLLLFQGPESLWRSNGTSAGTYSLLSFAGASSQPVKVGSIVYVFDSVGNATRSRGLYKTDGSVAGTTLVKAFASGLSPSSYFHFDEHLIFTMSIDGRSQFFTSDGTDSGTYRFTSAPLIGSFALAQVGGKTLVTIEDEPHGAELWQSDLTESGTTLLKDINTNTESSNPVGLTEVNGHLWFKTSEKIWRSDGTDSGTVPVFAFPSPATNTIDEAASLNGLFIFFHGKQLWRSDGTDEGTFLLKSFRQVNPGVRMMVWNQLVFFVADDNTRLKAWRTDGTIEGTMALVDATAFSYVSAGDQFVLFDNSLFFPALGDSGNFLYRSDGTPQGTIPVTGPVSNSGVVYHGRLYYSGCDETSGCELRSTDGTPEGSVKVKEIFDGPLGGGSIRFTISNDILFFAGYDGTNGLELWKTDGTAGGTFMVKDTYSGPVVNSQVNDLIDLNGTLIFSAETSSGFRDIWRSDGTADGTFLVASPTHSTLVTVSNFRRFGNLILFQNNTTELWKTDGTADGTQKISGFGSTPAFGGFPFLTVGDTAYFAASRTDVGGELFKLSAPVARISRPLVLGTRSNAQLGASGSSDADPTETLSFAWDLDNDDIFGETGAAAANGDETGPIPTFFAKNTPAGNVPITLRVTNSFGLSSETTSSIRIAHIGDLNFDNQVTIADFIQLASHFNQSPASWEEGDLNGDDAVTIADFIALSSNFGQSSAGEGTPAAPLSVTATVARKRVKHHRPKPRHHLQKQPHLVLLSRRLAEKR